MQHRRGDVEVRQRLAGRPDRPLLLRAALAGQARIVQRAEQAARPLAAVHTVAPRSISASLSGAGLLRLDRVHQHVGQMP